ncbi:hypothetical protein Sjap_019771 [Stephania japonica]|uniref:Uncharacterized protein n=1 Tax=Stephania japonica TaxID=461633 RepID=A0AAP0F284_9MAGN
MNCSHSLSELLPTSTTEPSPPPPPNIQQRTQQHKLTSTRDDLVELAIPLFPSFILLLSVSRFRSKCEEIVRNVVSVVGVYQILG